MKILKLTIKDTMDQIIRKISFKKVGVSFIYGDIKKPNDLGATINSLGKTLLIKCIDYIYGANEDSKIIKNKIHGYVIEAVVEYNDDKYNVKRILGKSEDIFIDDKQYSLTKYKDFFNIKRSKYGKQLIINKKANEISSRTNPNEDDILDFLDLLKLDKLLESVKAIYSSQDVIKKYKQNKKDLIAFYGDFNLKQIDEEIYFVDKEVTRLTQEVDVISNKIKKIEIADLQTNVVEDYARKSFELKKTKSALERNKIECNRLIEFIDSSNKVDISSEHILEIYKRTKQEVPDLVKRKIQEVEIFHQKVFEERKEFLNNKRVEIEKNMKKMEAKIESISLQIDKLGNIISTNQVYQESINIYEKFNGDLQELKYKEGKLSQVKNIDNKIDIEDSNLTINFEKASMIRKSYTRVIEGYRDYIYSMTKAIYNDDINSYFDIKIRSKHKTRRPILLELTLKGDTGEGVNEVKKNLIDYLLFKYNEYSEVLIHDSSCYNGIDPRQVSGMLSEIEKIAIDSKKQAIIAINKYQLGEYKEIIDFVKDKSVIILSEKDKLLRFDFD